MPPIDCPSVSNFRQLSKAEKSGNGGFIRSYNVNTDQNVSVTGDFLFLSAVGISSFAIEIFINQAHISVFNL